MSISPVKLYQRGSAEVRKKAEKVSAEFCSLLQADNPDFLTLPPEILNDPQAYLKRLGVLGEWSFSRLEVFCKLRRDLNELKPLVDQIPQPNNKKDWVAHLREYIHATEENIIEMQTLEARRFCIITKATHSPLDSEKSESL